MSQQLGITSEIIPRIATPFGGGIGGRGEVCGAVIGSVMAIGLKYGREEPSQSNQQAYALAREFCRRFEEETGSLSCRELTGMDLSARQRESEPIGVPTCPYASACRPWAPPSAW